jgi:TIR domain
MISLSRSQEKIVIMRRLLADTLKRRDVAVFYDKYEKATLWGKNLYTHLSDVYQDQAHYCVMLLSQHYATKVWTNHEREAAQARAFREHKEYILPVRLDDTEIPGIPPTIGYLKWPPETAGTIADAILFKLGKAAVSQPLVRKVLEDPSTPLLIAAEEQEQRTKREKKEREANKAAEEVQQQPSSQQKLSLTIPISAPKEKLDYQWIRPAFLFVLIITAIGLILYREAKLPVERQVPKWRQFEQEVVTSNGLQKPTVGGTLPLTPEPTAGLPKPEAIPEWQQLEPTVVTPTRISKYSSTEERGQKNG